MEDYILREVMEYRRNNPHCKYCLHNGGYCGVFDLFPFCKAKEQYIVKNHASKCTLYKARVYSGK